VQEHAIEGRGTRSRASQAPLLDAARERMLLVAALRGDERATSELVQSHIKLVTKIAARYRRVGLIWEDLMSEGVLGLMEALRRFDVSQEARFATYACWWIRARIGQYALAHQRLVRIPSHAPRALGGARATPDGTQACSAARADAHGPRAGGRARRDRRRRR
jgi:DNA-directed RNA polymerase sigma subunit (sigma70/sigma32)